MISNDDETCLVWLVNVVLKEASIIVVDHAVVFVFVIVTVRWIRHEERARNIF